jgi:hypothetical protein
LQPQKLIRKCELLLPVPSSRLHSLCVNPILHVLPPRGLLRLYPFVASPPGPFGFLSWTDQVLWVPKPLGVQGRSLHDARWQLVTRRYCPWCDESAPGQHIVLTLLGDALRRVYRLVVSIGVDCQAVIVLHVHVMELDLIQGSFV